MSSLGRVEGENRFSDPLIKLESRVALDARGKVFISGRP
jgi:hypothetical protein